MNIWSSFNEWCAIFRKVVIVESPWRAEVGTLQHPSPIRNWGRPTKPPHNPNSWAPIAAIGGTARSPAMPAGKRWVPQEWPRGWTQPALLHQRTHRTNTATATESIVATKNWMMTTSWGVSLYVPSDPSFGSLDLLVTGKISLTTWPAVRIPSGVKGNDQMFDLLTLFAPTLLISGLPTFLLLSVAKSRSHYECAFSRPGAGLSSA